MVQDFADNSPVQLNLVLDYSILRVRQRLTAPDFHHWCGLNGIYLYHISTGDNLVVQNCTMKFFGYNLGGGFGAGVYTDEITYLKVHNCDISYVNNAIWNGRDATGCIVDIQNNTISYCIMGSDASGIAFGGDTQNEISYNGSIIKNNDISKFMLKGISCSHSSYHRIV